MGNTVSLGPRLRRVSGQLPQPRADPAGSLHGDGLADSVPMGPANAILPLTSDILQWFSFPEGADPLRARAHRQLLSTLLLAPSAPATSPTRGKGPPRLAL